MNQILATENNREKNKKTKTKSSSSTPLDVKSIVRFFAIAIIIFAVLLVSIGIYAMIRNKNKATSNVTGGATVPTVSIEQEGQQVVISIKHDKAIDKIKYRWNNGEETTLQGKGRTQIKENIMIPIGENSLHVEIKDSAGKEVKYDRNFTLVDGQDINKPTIEFTDDGEGNIKIVAKDDGEMSYITYAWNEEEETKVEVFIDSPKQIQEKIKSREGKNTLKVVAVDKTGNKTEKEQEVYAGEPKVTVFQEGDKLKIHVEDSVEITKIAYVLNGRGYESGELSETSLDFEQELDVGDNIITLMVTNKYGKQAKFEGRCTR